MTAASTTDVRRRAPMDPWRLEWLRMTRSPRGPALLAVYLFFGLAGPLMAKFMPELAGLASSGVTLVVPEPKPADGIVNFISQGSQTGLIVVSVVAASALTLDAHRGLATFYRTRVSRARQLIWPRYVVTCAVTVFAYVLGTLAAWYGTTLILGDLPVDRVLVGLLCGTLFLLFAVAVVAAAATFGRSTLATVGISVTVLLLVLPIAGIADAVAAWLPSTLMSAPAALVTDPAMPDLLRPVAVSVAVTAGLLILAIRRAGRREL